MSFVDLYGEGQIDWGKGITCSVYPCISRYHVQHMTVAVCTCYLLLFVAAAAVAAAAAAAAAAVAAAAAAVIVFVVVIVVLVVVVVVVLHDMIVASIRHANVKFLPGNMSVCELNMFIPPWFVLRRVPVCGLNSKLFSTGRIVLSRLVLRGVATRVESVLAHGQVHCGQVGGVFYVLAKHRVDLDDALGVDQ